MQYSFEEFKKRIVTKKLVDKVQNTCYKSSQIF